MSLVGGKGRTSTAVCQLSDIGSNNYRDSTLVGFDYYDDLGTGPLDGFIEEKLTSTNKWLVNGGVNAAVIAENIGNATAPGMLDLQHIQTVGSRNQKASSRT